MYRSVEVFKIEIHARDQICILHEIYKISIAIITVNEIGKPRLIFFVPSFAFVIAVYLASKCF